MSKILPRKHTKKKVGEGQLGDSEEKYHIFKRKESKRHQGSGSMSDLGGFILMEDISVGIVDI